MLLLSVMTTLRPLANTAEVFTVLASSGHFDFVGPLIGAIIFAYIVYRTQEVFCRTRIPPRRIRDLLSCTLTEATTVNQYLSEVGISWMLFYRWVNACECKLTPMMFFDNGKDEQFVATWGESRRAMLKLALERRLDPKWGNMDAVGAVTLEIIKERQAKGRGIYMPTMEIGED